MQLAEAAVTLATAGINPALFGVLNSNDKEHSGTQLLTSTHLMFVDLPGIN